MWIHLLQYSTTCEQYGWILIKQVPLTFPSGSDSHQSCLGSHYRRRTPSPGGCTVRWHIGTGLMCNLLRYLRNHKCRLSFNSSWVPLQLSVYFSLNLGVSHSILRWLRGISRLTGWGHYSEILIISWRNKNQQDSSRLKCVHIRPRLRLQP